MRDKTTTKILRRVDYFLNKEVEHTEVKEDLETLFQDLSLLLIELREKDHDLVPFYTGMYRLRTMIELFDVNKEYEAHNFNDNLETI